jgi:hypothetical protein
LLKSGKKRAFTGPKTNKLKQPLLIPNLSPSCQEKNQNYQPLRIFPRIAQKRMTALPGNIMDILQSPIFLPGHF